MIRGLGGGNNDIEDGMGRSNKQKHNKRKRRDSNSSDDDRQATVASPGNNNKKDLVEQLPDDFEPGQFDVICSRGKWAMNAPGNVKYRNLIRENLQRYSSTSSKQEKSTIVSEIVQSIQDLGTGFVRQVSKTWYVVSDHIAREKTGQMFRDALHTQYRSSTKAKRQRQKERDMVDCHKKVAAAQQRSFSSSVVGTGYQNNTGFSHANATHQVASPKVSNNTNANQDHSYAMLEQPNFTAASGFSVAQTTPFTQHHAQLHLQQMQMQIHGAQQQQSHSSNFAYHQPISYQANPTAPVLPTFLLEQQAPFPMQQSSSSSSSTAGDLLPSVQPTSDMMQYGRPSLSPSTTGASAPSVHAATSATQYGSVADQYAMNAGLLPSSYSPFPQMQYQMPNPQNMMLYHQTLPGYEQHHHDNDDLANGEQQQYLDPIPLHEPSHGTSANPQNYNLDSNDIAQNATVVLSGHLFIGPGGSQAGIDANHFEHHRGDQKNI